MTNCKNCKSEVTGNFCSNCGQPAAPKRIDKHYIIHEAIHLLHFEKGFLYTVKELTIRPGKAVKEFMTENRTKHVKPVAYLILTSLIYSILSHYFHIHEEPEINTTLGKSSLNYIMHWIQGHFGYANILMGLFIAAWIKLFFNKYGYNFFEIIILLCFVMGHGMLLLSFETLFSGLMYKELYTGILAFIVFTYTAWAIGQFFNKTKPATYLMAFLAYFLGYASFYVLVFIIVLIYDVASAVL